MQITGIIAEYNPLHQGHLFHIQQTKKLLHPDVLIVLVSSWFSQRGLPSLLSPKDKTRLALEAGADLVLELPWVYAAQAADQFALYSLEALKTAGITSLCFGSETNDLAYLRQAAQALQEVQKNPKSSLARNMEKALQNPASNDILGIQYVRYCQEFGIEPYPIQRNPQFKSATQTRKDFFAGKPQFLQDYLLPQACWDTFYPYLRLYLQLSSPQLLGSFFLAEEGIEHRLVRLAKKYADWPSFLEAAITRTYTRARIQRTCLFMLLQITKEEMISHSSFFAVRVLGANQKGRAYLKTLPVGTPIYTRFRDLPPFLRRVEIQAKTLYNAILPVPVEEGLVIVE